MYIIIAGCGRAGSALAQAFSYERHDVVVIDKDQSSFRRLGGTFNGITLEGIAFDEELLVEAGIEQADAFVAVTNFDNTNLMAAEVASSIYEVPHVLSRLYSPEKELTYFKMGIDYVCGTTLVTDHIREKLFQREDVIVQQDRLDVGIQVVEFSISLMSRGIPAGNLNSGVNSRLITVVRSNMELDRTQDIMLETGDHVIVALRKEGWRVIMNFLGESALVSGACPVSMLPVETPDAAVTGQASEKAKVIIGGCSQVGAHLAYVLFMEGCDVTVIDANPSLFKRLPKQFNGNTLEGTVFDEETLTAAGIENADAFVAVTKFDNTNLMAVEVARHIYGVPHVMARLFNLDKEQTYQALSMPYVCGTRLLAQSLHERILKPLVAVKASCFFNKFDLVEFECPANWKNKSVGWARDLSGMSFAYITRRTTGHLPDDNFIIRDGDIITALATPKRLEKLEKSLDRVKRSENNSYRNKRRR
ncbi:MAG: hypothetical protein CVT63_03250 [Candidatus Anoxymicrobium japonicum]|uniref:Trk system potassium uptake protein TrkA n=1 Tax=Candidatus Anoxymicrobium japonicum TaxID=2013648 RepID=A0A2N3G6J8_9ACTN|nr:MAG: hypothetical protein CVT63_03250 [Candidatus Anoxymicrobium japonicum]